MAIPRERKQHKHATIILGPPLAGRIDPLDETMLLYEQIVSELVDGGHDGDDDGKIALGSMWPS